MKILLSPFVLSLSKHENVRSSFDRLRTSGIGGDE